MTWLALTDYNGTCFEYPNSEALNRYIGYAILYDAMVDVFRGRLRRVKDIRNLLKAKSKIDEIVKGYYGGERHPSEIYELFNDLILKGIPVSLINEAVDTFAEKNKGKLDGRILRPMRSVKESGIGTGILSVTYKGAIVKTLERAGYADVFDEENIIANALISEDGIAIAFTLRIYEEKWQVLEDEFFKKRGFRPENTLYIGDDIKDDGPVAEMLPKGYFIVPFLATDEAREELSRKYGAFVPEDERDLRRYLLRL